MNTCANCNNPVPEEKAFCPNCGAAMVEERQRVEEFSEEMGETMVGISPPTPIAAAPKPVVNPALSETVPAPQPVRPPRPKPKPATPASSAQQQPAQPSAPVADNNQRLYLILGAAAVLFALSILFVVILYVMGKI